MKERKKNYRNKINSIYYKNNFINIYIKRGIKKYREKNYIIFRNVFSNDSVTIIMDKFPRTLDTPSKLRRSQNHCPDFTKIIREQQIVLSPKTKKFDIPATNLSIFYLKVASELGFSDPKVSAHDKGIKHESSLNVNLHLII